MKVISPGAVALRPYRIIVDQVTTDMVHWWVSVGGKVYGRADSYANSRGHIVKAERAYLSWDGRKWCHYHVDGTTNVTIHMPEESAPEGSLFILKFNEHVIDHTLKVAEPQLD